MFDEVFKDKFKKSIIFIIVYTLFFIAFVKTIKYTFPFLLAFLICMMIRPITEFIHKKLKIKKGIISLLLTILLLSTFITIVGLILAKLSIETKQLLNDMNSNGVVYGYIEKPLEELTRYFNNIDISIGEKIYNNIFKYTSKVLDLGMLIANTMFSLAIKVPVFFMIFFVTLISIYFISNDLNLIEDKFFSMFSNQGKDKVKKIFVDMNNIIFGYIKSYSIIICVTFIESFTGFYILNIEYTFIFSILAAIFDIFPFVGVGIIYFPIAIYSFFTKNYIAAIGIVILYVIVNIIRQIIEPKLLSSNIGIHPLLMIMSLFIGLQVSGFTGVIYFVSIMVLYKALKKVDIL